MEFSTSRGTQAPAPARVASTGTNGAAGGNGGSKSKNGGWKHHPVWLRAALMVLLFAGTVLIVAMLVLLYFGGTKEEDYVDKKKVQAVFLTNGQVYFGKIQTINRNYVDLQQIYYLNVNQQVQPNQKDSQNSNQSVSLVKLGCELHGPTDRMIVNRDQITFWENLRTEGQVTEAIDKWIEQNPNGQDCEKTTSNSSNSNANKNEDEGNNP